MKTPATGEPVAIRRIPDGAVAVDVRAPRSLQPLRERRPSDVGVRAHGARRDAGGGASVGAAGLRAVQRQRLAPRTDRRALPGSGRIERARDRGWCRGQLHRALAAAAAG